MQGVQVEERAQRSVYTTDVTEEAPMHPACLETVKLNWPLLPRFVTSTAILDTPSGRIPTITDGHVTPPSPRSQSPAGRIASTQPSLAQGSGRVE